MLPVNTACQQDENMDSLNALLDKIKETRSLATDMALADLLGVGRAAVSAWRNGHRLPDPVQCARIAELSGAPLGRVIGLVGEARALSREEKAVWRRIASAAAVLLVALMPTMGKGSASSAAPMTESATVYTLCAITARLRWWIAARVFTLSFRLSSAGT
jgi:hypothetical protein